MNAVTTPDDAEMPEIAAHGSLAAALHAVAPDLRIEPEHDRRVRVPSARPGRDPLSVAPAAVAGMWAFGAWSGGIQMIHGMCGSLADLVPVATAWQDGSTRPTAEAGSECVLPGPARSPRPTPRRRRSRSRSRTCPATWVRRWPAATTSPRRAHVDQLRSGSTPMT
jgi:hypothetical protein